METKLSSGAGTELTFSMKGNFINSRENTLTPIASRIPLR